jgi:hypothetical protein
VLVGFNRVLVRFNKVLVGFWLGLIGFWCGFGWVFFTQLVLKLFSGTLPFPNFRCSKKCSRDETFFPRLLLCLIFNLR